CSETLMESELLGYVEGAFTGASKQGKAGLFEMAHKGTIFLDEISEMPLSIQSKLLRVLQEKAVMRLGDDRVIPVDVRIIAASNKNLNDMVKNGQFRKDLYYRLNVLTLRIPLLKDRQQDILRLLEHFLEIYCIKFNIKRPIIAQEVYQILLNYQWPGNVRELENFTERLLAAYGSSYITADQIGHILDLKELHDFRERSGHTKESPDRKILDEKTLFEILKSNNFNKPQTAKQLGIGRTTLWRMLKKMNISNES
ncbi:MAG: sigma 54-interacting transcriptional regulator, partial [Thermoanaerobacteraceae bacterium]|nr:sigma 54-interacting transcriptional regulator [Thermoanaerobacteraceae bacterium]